MDEFIKRLTYFDKAEIGRYAASGTVKTETAGAAFRIFFTQVEKSGFASITSFAFNISLSVENLVVNWQFINLFVGKYLALAGRPAAGIGNARRVTSARFAIGETVVAGSAAVAFQSSETLTTKTLSLSS